MMSPSERHERVRRLESGSIPPYSGGIPKPAIHPMSMSQPTASHASASTDEVFGQARSGSITAIIQILNARLVGTGVRTRAILEGGWLELLCEAEAQSSLAKSKLLPKVQTILEEISPRNIANVRLYSRINQEQQLLWLDEVRQNRRGQVLWTEELKLTKPPFFKQLTEDWQYSRQKAKRISELKAQAQHQPSRIGDWSRVQRSWTSALIGGVSVAAVVMAGWMLWDGYQERRIAQQAASPPQQQGTDAFAQAVRLAEEASIAGQTAAGEAEWLALAANWQEASALMAQVPDSDPRYLTAQDRVAQYSQNSQAALTKAGK